MKKKLKKLVIIAMLIAPFPASALSLQELACGATICLTDEAAGGESCNPYLDKYYSIKVKGKLGKISKKATELARKRFLSLCKKKSGPAPVDLRN